MASASSAQHDGPSAMDELLQNLAALDCGLKLTAADFKGKGASVAVREVLHFLYCTHKGEEAQRAISHIWPLQAGEDEKYFRDHMAAWVRELQRFQKVKADFEQLQQVTELVGKITARIVEEDHVVDCAAHVDQAAQTTTEAGEVDLVRFFSQCVEVKEELVARLDDQEWDLLRQLCEQLGQKLSRARALLGRLQASRTSVDALLEELEGQLAAAVASLEADQPDNSAEE